MSLTNKFILTFLLVTLIPIGIIILVARQNIAEHSQQEVGIRLEDSVVQVRKGMDEFLSNSIHNIQTMAANPDLNLSNLDSANRDLARLTYSFSYFAQVMMVNRVGVIIASSDDTSIGVSLFRDFPNTRSEFALAFAARSGSAYLSMTDPSGPPNPAVTKDRQGNRLLQIQILAPVKDSEGRPVGVLVGDVLTRQLLWLLEDLQRQAPGNEAPFLVDQAGWVLMSAKPSIQLHSVQVDAAGGALREALDSAKDGHLVYADARGEKRMVGYSSLATYGDNKALGWRLISQASYQTIMKPADESFNRLTSILFVTLVGAAGLGFGAAKRQIKPLSDLTSGAKMIAGGEYNTRVVATDGDEIGILVRPLIRWLILWKKG